MHSNGNQSKAANILGLNRATLRKKLHRYNIIEKS
jgi:DNA-binding protein Fis